MRLARVVGQRRGEVLRTRALQRSLSGGRCFRRVAGRGVANDTAGAAGKRLVDIKVSL